MIGEPGDEAILIAYKSRCSCYGRTMIIHGRIYLGVPPTSLSYIYTDGVSLQLQREIIPNNSLINFDDLLYNTQPTNINGLQTLMCVTDLVACCKSPQALGDWYYPDGRKITGVGSPVYRINRGQKEVLNHNQQFYGSVRLWRKYTPRERGLFCCELPDASNVVHTLCVNICEFPMIFCSYLL